MGDTGGAGARVSIASDMAGGPAHRAPEPDGAARAPEPPDRPSPHAQWDEVRARWVEWDADAGAWVVCGDDPSDAPTAPPA